MSACCPDLSRRTLLKAVGAALVAAPFVSARAAYADGYTGDVLVVLSLRGGMDGLSLVAPVGDPDYARLRPSIGVPARLGVPTGDRTFALHPGLAPLKPLWDAGRLGAVHAVGSPDGSRSHFQATEELERSAPGTSVRTGWLDRVLGTRSTGTVFGAVQLGSGSPSRMLSGPSPELATRSLSSFRLEQADWIGPRMVTALTALHEGVSSPAVPAARTTFAALAATDAVVRATPTPSGGAVYPDGDLGAALRDTRGWCAPAPGCRASASTWATGTCTRGWAPPAPAGWPTRRASWRGRSPRSRPTSAPCSTGCAW